MGLGAVLLLFAKDLDSVLDGVWVRHLFPYMAHWGDWLNAWYQQEFWKLRSSLPF